MAKAKFDTKKWLVEDLGFSEDEAKDLIPKFEAKAEKVGSGFLRQSDYDRLMNESKAELQKGKADLDAANEKLNAEMAEWASLTAAEKAQATQLRADLEKAQQDVLKHRQIVTRIATEAGLDPEKVLAGTAEPKKEEPKPQQVDLSGLAKAEQLAGLANMALTLPAELMAIAAEHQELTGERLDTRDIIRELQARAQTKGNQKSLDPRQIWEELKAIPEKRTEVEKKRFDDAIKAAEARGREAALTEASIPGQQPPGRHAPVFVKQESKLQRPQPGTSLQSAIAALRTGKYATGQKKPA